MDKFLRKHEIDVGRTFGVLFFFAMVGQIYDLIFDPLFKNTWNFNFVGILILYFLAKGMYQHNNIARQLTLVFVGVLIAFPFIQGPKRTFEYITIFSSHNLPFWKLLICFFVFLPLFWAVIGALRSKKTLEEFTKTEQEIQSNHGTTSGQTEA